MAAALWLALAVGSAAPRTLPETFPANLVSVELGVDASIEGQVKIEGTYLVWNTPDHPASVLYAYLPQGATEVSGVCGDQPTIQRAAGDPLACALNPEAARTQAYLTLRVDYTLKPSVFGGVTVLGRPGYGDWPLVVAATSAARDGGLAATTLAAPNDAHLALVPDQWTGLKIDVITRHGVVAVATGRLKSENLKGTRSVFEYRNGGLIPYSPLVVVGGVDSVVARSENGRVSLFLARKASGLDPQVALRQLETSFTKERQLLGDYPWDNFLVAAVPAAASPEAGVALPGATLIPVEVFEEPEPDSYAGLNRSERAKAHDLVEFVQREIPAHELAHQWLPYFVGATGDLHRYFEVLAELIAFEVAAADAPAAARDFLGFERHQYFQACGKDIEPTLRDTDAVRETECTQAVMYRRAPMLLEALLDHAGRAGFFGRLHRLIETRTPGQKGIGTGALGAVLGAVDNPKGAIDELLHERITFRNEAKVVAIDGGFDVTVTAHRFADGAGPKRRELKEGLSQLPVGFVDCSGIPVITDWISIQPQMPTHVRLQPSRPAAQVGIDPRNELLDDGERAMVEVLGSGGCPTVSR